MKIGNNYKTLIDSVEGDYYIGRTEFDSPEIDNEVLIKRDSVRLVIGDFYPVKIIGAEEFDLYGEVNL
jgi:ribosomal protein S12 methylthiotransferase